MKKIIPIIAICFLSFVKLIAQENFHVLFSLKNPVMSYGVFSPVMQRNDIKALTRQVVIIMPVTSQTRILMTLCQYLER